MGCRLNSIDGTQHWPDFVQRESAHFAKAIEAFREARAWRRKDIRLMHGVRWGDEPAWVRHWRMLTRE